MKKYVSSLMLALAAVAFTACSDVPEPYGINLTKQGTTKTGQLINESFASSLGTFKSISTVGDYMWSNQGHGCVQVSSYADGTNYDADAYLISPKATLEAKDYHVTFDYILRYGQAATLAQNHTVLVSADYNGDPATATWEALAFTPVEGSDWDTWAHGDLAIPTAYQGQSIVVAFRYIGTTTKAATWEVKNFILAEGKPEGGGGGSDPDKVQTPPYEETFATSLGNFVNKTTSGEGSWVIDYSTAKATGYNQSTKVTTPGTYYLLSPAIDLSTVSTAHVAYEYILRYNKGDENQQVLISADYNGDPATATWTLLKKFHTEGSDWKTWSNADITVPADFIGKTIRVAFYYNTTTDGSTWEVKNFSIKEGTGSQEAEKDPNWELFANEGFENWNDDNTLPINWQEDSSRGNATLAQSTDAHSGSYAVSVAGVALGERRLASKTVDFEAGTYTCTFYAKAATSDGASVQTGYYPESATAPTYTQEGSGNKKTAVTNGEWTKISYSFTIEAKEKVAVIISVPTGSKNKAALIDDLTITKN